MEILELNSLPEPIGKFDAFYYLIEHLASINVGLTVKEISENIGKSEKTVRRYLDSIEKSILGIELEKERDSNRNFRYRVKKHEVPFRPLLLNSYEVIALNFIRGFSHFKDFPFISNNVESVFNKISISASETKEKSGNDFQERVSKIFIMPKQLGGKVYNKKEELLFIKRLIEAALEYKVCNLVYGIGENSKNYKIAPLHFFNYRDAIYIIAKDINDSEYKYKNFALHRMKKVVILQDESFKYPSDFNVKKYFKSNVFNIEGEKHTIKLKFAPHSKDYILEREWFPNQKEDVLNDDSIVLEFESDINMILIGWIRGFGPDVEVLEPKELRNKIINDVKETLKIY